MSDLDFFLVCLVMGPLAYAGITLRKVAQRLHYRDRPLFWRGLIPLVLPAAVGLWASIRTLQGEAELVGQVIAVLCSWTTGAAVWWIDLDPARFVGRLHARR